MYFNKIGKIQPKLKFRKPDTHLVGAEFTIAQLHVQQPVVKVSRLRPFPIEQKFL